MADGIAELWRVIEGLGPFQRTLASLIVLAGVVLLGLLLNELLVAMLRRFVRKPAHGLNPSFVRRWRGPLRVLVPVLMAMAAAPALFLPGRAYHAVAHLLEILLILALARGAVGSLEAFREFLLRRYGIVSDQPLSLQGRRIHTQVKLVERIFIVLVILAALSLILMSFEPVRQVGVSVLASAGIIGVILGFAAQKSIAALFAGMQIAITQPIRLGDAVLVEGEWGRVEEINLTYVVVNTWDLRRLVLPTTYFLEKPFQNWTRTQENLLGTVLLYTDYAVPVDRIRQELDRLLLNQPLWDRKLAKVQVTEARESALELRVLLSAANAADLFNLRCHIREQLLDFLRREFPHSLPRQRVEVQGPTP